MSDDESMFGHLEDAGSALWGAASSAGDAVLNVESAALDATAGVGGIVAEGFVGMAAGGAYAVGEDETAASLRGTQNTITDDAIRYFGDAGREIDQAGADVWGGTTDVAGDVGDTIE
jgi:hypothetical protein